SSEHSDTDVSKARWGGAMAGAHHLHGFAFSAVRCAPEFPVFLIADGVTGIPELGCDSPIRAVAEQSRSLAFLDLVTELRSELKVETHVVDAPRTVCLHVDTIVGV